MQLKYDVKKVGVVFIIGCILVIFLCVNGLDSAIEKKSTIPADMALKPSKKYSASVMAGADPNSNTKVISSDIFSELVQTASNHPRKRKMNDLTKDPEHNTMQTLVNTWTSGSYSPVHKHDEYSEAFVILQGALAFFTFTDTGDITCNVLSDTPSTSIKTDSSVSAEDRVIIVEKNTWHAMTAAPVELGYPGYAVIFETSGHVYDTSKATKILAPFAPVFGDGMNGDPQYFAKILTKCPRNKNV